MQCRQICFKFAFSCSYRYDWKIEEASKNIMRTHTTAVSSRMLYKLAQQVGDIGSTAHQVKNQLYMCEMFACETIIGACNLCHCSESSDAVHVSSADRAHLLACIYKCSKAKTINLRYSI